MSTDQLEAVNYELRKLEKEFPSLAFVPNIGQEKAFDFYHRLDMAPHISLFGGGNGVGKTAALGIHLVGLIWGLKYLNKFFDKYKMYEEYQELLKNRNRKGHIRIVCHADGMKEGGAVWQAIDEWFPKGPDPENNPIYTLKKGGKSYYSQIIIHTKGAPHVEIKTHDQDSGAHAGSTIDWVLGDEPFPESLWTETIGRTRDGGHIALYLTPLKMAGWMMDQIVDKVDGREIMMTNASIWENCIDIPGTRGHLTRNNINKMIDAWRRSSPDEVDARVEGAFTHLSGSIYKVYNPSAHEMDEFAIPPDWPVWMIIDPHDTKPPAILWILQGPDGQQWAIREWPKEDYIQMGHSSLTIAQLVQIVREIEAPFVHQITETRIMDPNKGAFTYGNTKNTIQTEWTQAGLRTRLAPIDDLDVGHKRVNRLIHYDRNKPFDEFNRPNLRFWKDHCPNTCKAMARYGLKAKYAEGSSLTAKISPKYKDFADCVRYYAVSCRPFQSVSDRCSFVDQLLSGRVSSQ